MHLPILEDDGPDRNLLRGTLLEMLGSRDERLVLVAACALLSALRRPDGQTELLRQSGLMPLRQLRSESLLAQVGVELRPFPEPSLNLP